MVVMRSASRTQVGGSVAEVLMLSNSEINSPKYGPEANVLSQRHKTSARLEMRFSGDCSGNKLFRAYGSHCSLSLAASRHSWLSLWEFCLELFTIQPKQVPIHKPAGTIHKLAGTMYKLAGTASKLVGTF